MTVGGADTFWQPRFFSTVTFESQRSTEEERSWSVWQLLLNFNTVPQLTRVTAGGMFELESLVMQYFGSLPLTPRTPSRLPWHDGIACRRTGIPT